VPLIPVPNALRRKATGLPDKIPFAECLKMVQEQKAERHTFQIGYLIDRINAHFTGRKTAENIGGELDKLKQGALDLMRRISDTRYARENELSCSLVHVSNELAAGAAPRKNDLVLLHQLAKALDLAIHSDDIPNTKVAHKI
jgi:hypothetical protein